HQRPLCRRPGVRPGRDGGGVFGAGQEARPPGCDQDPAPRDRRRHGRRSLPARDPHPGAAPASPYPRPARLRCHRPRPAPARLTQAGLRLGTPAYMSPEQAAADREIDARADQYSLACVVYELLAGQPPFTGPSMAAVLSRQVLDPVPPLTTLRPGVPASLRRAIDRALAKVPADRFGSVLEFLSAMEVPDAPAAET